MRKPLKTKKNWAVSVQVLACSIFLLLIVGYQLTAQSVRILSTKDGLPQSFVSGLTQDKDGFVWIGTRNGLSRFDGIEHKLFQHDLHDTSTIASNIIIWINRDVNNHLWIEHESGEIDKLDPVTGKVVHFLAQPALQKPAVHFVRKSWLVDSKGLFWGIIKGHGLNTFSKASSSVKLYSRASDGFLSDTLRGILEDSAKQIWVLSQYDLSKFDSLTQRFIHYPIPSPLDFNNYLNSDEELVGLHERKNGEIMWGDRKSLYFFNPVSRLFRTVALLAYYRNGIRWIITGPDGKDYFETNGEVYRYGDVEGLKIMGNVKMNNPGDARSFIVDRSGLLWIGTNADGIHQIDLVTPFFTSYPQIRNFPQDLLQQEFRLPMDAAFNWLASDYNFSLPGYHFRSAYDYSRGRLYMALKETVVVDEFRKGKFTTLPAVPVAQVTIGAGIGIKGITVTPEGVIMVLGLKGQIFFYDSTHRLWQQFITPDLIRNSFGADVSPLDILADKDKLWITTVNDGLIYIDVETRQLHQLKAGTNKGDLPSNQLLGLRGDPTRANILWVGSYQGLIMFNKKTLQSEVFSIKEGLSDYTIYSILADRAGNLWVSTNKGICRLNPITRQVKVFRTSYGLPGDEFNRFHDLELPDGRLAFGGTQGWTIFDPLSIKTDDYEPKVSLTNLKINNNPVSEQQMNNILSGPLNTAAKLDLPFSDNTISISFAGLQFNQPQDLLYRYRLKGYDDNNWVAAGHTPIASYTKIPPGTYTLLVNASNTNDKWSSYIKSIVIVIHPPWWRTWWAYICYTIILFGMAWGYITFRINSGILRQEMRLKEKESRQLREVDEMKTTFFSNITHEFRTPLTLILGPAEELKQRHQQDDRQVKLSDTIIRNAGQLLFLINQLMELAKLEGKALKPTLKNADILASVGSVVYSFENDARLRKISLVLESNNITGNYMFAPEVLERIIYNLVSNAVKFTPSGGSVTISLSGTDNGVELLVSDTGTGIAEDQLPFIFDRFYQVKDSKNNTPQEQYPYDHKGTGIGLAIVKELVELQDGTVTVQSILRTPALQNSGTQFTILLPYKPATRQDEAERQNGLQEVSNEEEQQSVSETKLQLLLAEDNAELADFITGSLQDAYSVYHVANGALAVEAALQTMPDIIVSDILMPEMDGIQLCKRLKTDIRTSHIPVVLLTAKTSQESRIEGLSEGADDYLTKPFHATELLLRIRNQLDQRRRITEYIQQQLSGTTAIVQPVETVITTDPFIDRLHQLVEENLDDSLFGVDQLVNALDMSRTSLHRKIKSLSGMSTTEVIRNYRLQRAASFLRQGENSTSTGYLTGFGSPSYFTKCFREKYGITPGEFIEQQKV